MEIDEGKLKTWGIALGVLLVAIVGVDYVALKGERVASGSTSLRSDAQPAVLNIQRAGETHLVEITTRRTVRGEAVGQSIAYSLRSPEGFLVHEDAELVSHKKRFFEFTPAEPGAYVFEAREQTLLGSGRGTARVSVTVGDHRLLSRWLGF